MTQIPTWSGGPASSTSNRAAPGATIGGRYALRAAVGHGGMGTVWRGTDTLLRRDVAVKEVILPAGMAPSDRDAMYERTLREARAAAALQHPAVVQVYDVVTEGGRPWIVMELLDARSLADMIIEDGPVPPRVVAKIGIALLGALEVAHANGVLHRDVKPANVLICSDGRCVLTDFGVARMPTDVQLTTPGMVLGSPHFISPERAMGQHFGPSSDLFSLGVTLYTAVEGRPPFDKGDPIETMHAVVEDPPAPPNRAGVLTEVLFGLLEKDPDQRFDVPTARSMLRTLLAGPLASKAPAHLMTDPYAVVPSQRTPETSTPAPARPTGQIGGRAMLKPGEALTGRLAATPSGAVPAAQSPAADRTRVDAAGPPTGAFQAPPAGSADLPGTAESPPVGQRWVEPGARPWTAKPAGRVVAARGTPVSRGLAGIRGGGASAVATVRNWPRGLRIAAGAGLVVVLLLGSVALFNRPDPAVRTTQQAQPHPTAPAGPSFETQTFTERGVSVNVPDGWIRKNGELYVDFVDPDDAGRKVRIIVEDMDVKPRRWVEIAENGLKSRRTSCAEPYEQVAVRDVTVAGRAGAEFEYTCGGDGHMRH
ncbi:MAG TPA: protein kinase, partial [Micromonosporaceae bacterium]|nr:protein kinase [Micromonosporaceae bacterium]